MCGYICIEFINYMLKDKMLLDYTNLFSPNDFKKKINLASHVTIVGIPVGIAGAYLSLIFTISTDINKSLLKVTKKKKET